MPAITGWLGACEWKTQWAAEVPALLGLGMHHREESDLVEGEHARRAVKPDFFAISLCKKR